jgi:hypothetical protein
MKKHYCFKLLAISLLICINLYSQERNGNNIPSEYLQKTSGTDENNKYIENNSIINRSSATIPTITSNPLNNPLTYCEANFSNCTDFINKVIFAGINNDSECSTGLNDYTDQVAVVQTGEDYMLSVRTESGAAQYVFAFIDWNQNGILDDEGEVYVLADFVHNNGPHVEIIEIPEDAALGETRMRIIMQWNNSNINPCINSSNGEAEDYTVNVVDEMPNDPETCSQWVPAGSNSSGVFFGGDTNQRLAIDIDILPESTFELDNLDLNTLDQATFFDIIFYNDNDGLPGETLLTLNDAQILQEVLLGQSSNYQYYKYKIDLTSQEIIFNGEAEGKKIWMELQTDATGWNYTTTTTLGYPGIFRNININEWTYTDYEYVYKLNGTCTGNQVQDIPNDACLDAIPLQCNSLVTGTTVGAEDFGGNNTPDVFYSYTGNGQPEVIGLSLCVGTSFHTIIRVFSDCSLSNEIAFNDEFCGYQSALSFLSDGVSTYYIMIEGSWTNSLGDFSLYVSCNEYPTQNQTPQNAISIECGNSYTGATLGASNTAGNVSGDVFYSYTGNGVEEDVTVSLCHVYTTFDTEIRVYDNINLTNLVAYNDNACGGKMSELTFYSDGTSTYYIMIEGFEAEEGSFNLSVSCWDHTPYCSPLNFVYVEPITYVEVADIAHYSSPDPTSPPHEVFTDIVGNMTQGETYEVALEGFTGDDGEWTNYFTIFIDWNQNNIFNDPGEMYEIGSIFNSTGTDGQQATGTITVPNDAILGETIMRVLKNYDVSPIDPCGNYGYGQVEDYTIQVSPFLTTGDNDLLSFNVYPNPVEDWVYINTDSPISNITFYDISGKEIQSYYPDNKHFKTDLSLLSSGIYFAKVLINDTVKTIKIIKK